MTGADSRSPIAILIGVGDKRRSRCVSLRVAVCAVAIACAALVVAAQQIRNVDAESACTVEPLATAQQRIR
jgi:hypothetical protein